MAETRKELFVEMMTHVVALIKDQGHDNLTPEDRAKRRTRVYQLADEVGSWFKDKPKETQ